MREDTPTYLGNRRIKPLREQGSVRMPVLKLADGLIGKPHNNLIHILHVHEYLTTGETKELGIASSSVAKARDIGYVIETLREDHRRLYVLKAKEPSEEQRAARLELKLARAARNSANPIPQTGAVDILGKLGLLPSGMKRREFDAHPDICNYTKAIRNHLWALYRERVA